MKADGLGHAKSRKFVEQHQQCQLRRLFWYLDTPLQLVRKRMYLNQGDID